MVVMSSVTKGGVRSTTLLLLLSGCVLWALWPVVRVAADRWSNDPRYAHAYLVPIFSLILLRMRRDRRRVAPYAPSSWDDTSELNKRHAVASSEPSWSGLAFIMLGAAFQLAGGYYRISTIEGLSLLIYLLGLTLLLGGWRAVDWAWPSIAFLGFMVPLPWRVENALGPPLQLIATTASTYFLQTLGFMAFAEGNVIQLRDARIGVVEACSGLSMVISFLALSSAAAMVVQRPLLDRMVLVASSIPVALVANIARITVTAILHETLGDHAASTFYHDFAGWVMIPLALLLYWLEIWILSHLLIETESNPAAPVGKVGSSRLVETSPMITKRYKPSAL
jgi:exosortase